MIHHLILLLSITLAASQNGPADALAKVANKPIVIPRIGLPTTAQFPVAQSQQVNKHKRRRRTNKKIKGKAKRASQLAQMANGVNSGSQNAGSAAPQNLAEELESNTIISSIIDDDSSAWLSTGPQDLTFDGSVSLDDNNGEGGNQISNEEDLVDKPDWVRIDAPTDEDEWSVVDDDKNAFF